MESDEERVSVLGALLRRYRFAANLTQEELAEHAGLSVHAVSMLERGARRAPRPTTVELLATALKLDVSERRRLVAAARSGTPGPPEPNAGIMPGPGSQFVGREEELIDIQRLLEQDGRVAIHGLGGVGKTQLVAQYAHESRSRYPDGVFWLRADQESILVGDLATLAWRLGLPEREEREQERQAHAVLSWLDGHQRWLLVLDNVEPAVEGAVHRWFPPGMTGHIVATAHAPMWPAHLRLEVLPQEVATRFLLQRTRRADTEAAYMVAVLLGCLPLALVQAAAYVMRSGRDLASYGDLLRARLVELMQEGAPDDHRLPVATALRLSYERLSRDHAQAAALLCLCAFLAPDDIPVGVLQTGARELGDELRDALADDIRFDRLAIALQRYALVERQGDRLRVHRVVQAVVRDSLPADQRQEWLGAAIRLLQPMLLEEPSAHPDHWPISARLVPHAMAVEQLSHDRMVEPEALSRVLDHTGMYLWARGQFAQALPFVERSLSIREQWLGADHPDTATSLSDLALVLAQHGEVTRARPLFERALTIRERVLGPDHLHTSTTLNGLASLLWAEGELVAATALYERALAIREGALSPDHVKVANSLNNLSNLLKARGQLTTATPLMMRALAICEGRLGPDHPYTATCLSGLGNLLQMQGDLNAARPLLSRSLMIMERVLGPDHPSTGRSLERLAMLVRVEEGAAAARPLLERAWAIYRGALTPDHLRTAECRRALDEVEAELAAVRAGPIGSEPPPA